MNFDIPAMAKRKQFLGSLLRKDCKERVQLLKSRRTKQSLFLEKKSMLAAKSYGGPMDIYIEKGLIKLRYNSRQNKGKIV